MEDFYDCRLDLDSIIDKALTQERGTTDRIGTKYFLSFLIE